MTKDYESYAGEKQGFFTKHHNHYILNVSDRDEYNYYYKEYYFDDGSMWYEIKGPVIERVKCRVHGLQIETDVKLYRTQYWSTDNTIFQCYYEKY